MQNSTENGKRQTRNALNCPNQTPFASLEPSQVVFGAIKAVFERWTALRLVVEHQLGGSGVEADELLHQTFAMAMNTSKKHDIDDFADLFYYTFEKLQSDIEDGSPEEIAEVVVRIKDAAAKGDLRPAIAEGTKSGITELAFAASIHGTASAGDSVSNLSDMQHVAPARAPSPVVDEDGFTQVQARSRHH